MPRRRECVFCGGTHGSRPTSHFVGGDVHIAPPPSGAAQPRCKAPSGRGLSAQPTGGEKTPPFASPSVSASRCHLPRRGRQGASHRRHGHWITLTALRAVGDGVLQWSAAEQMPLGYDVPSVGADGSVRPVRFAPRAVAKPCSIKKNRPRAVLFCLFRADRSGIRCRYRSRPGCSNSLSASQTRPRSHLPAD